MAMIPDIHVHVHFDDPEAHERIRELEAEVEAAKAQLAGFDLDPSFPNPPSPPTGAP